MKFQRMVTGFTVVSFLVAQLLIPVHAAMVGTQQFLAAEERAALIASIDLTLDRADVRSELEALGVDPEIARARVDALSDAELAEVAGQLDALPAGGDSLLALIGAVFVILLILELTGVINIFNKA